MSQHTGKTTSEEFDEQQMELARNEGEAYRQSLEYVVNEVAHAGDVRRVGDFVVGFAQEEAEGMYRLRGGELAWVEPDQANLHLEVAVCDADDGRFLPNVPVRATLVSEDGTETGPVELPYVWHPGLHHYGANVEVAGDGTYDLHVDVDRPAFSRHDRRNGDRYADGARVTFENVDVKTGRK